MLATSPARSVRYATATLALLTALAALASSCNYGAFGPPTNAGDTVCRCTCGVFADPNSGSTCFPTCKEPFDAAEKRATDTGCEAEFAAYTHCLESEGTCVDTSFDAPGCGSKLSIVNECEVDGSGGAGGSGFPGE